MSDLNDSVWGVLDSTPFNQLKTVLFLSFSRLSANMLARCAAVCRAWRAVALDSRLWEPLVRQKWPHFVVPLGERKRRVNFARLYRERIGVMEVSEYPDVVVENCVDQLFSFKCPIRWSQLESTNEPNRRFCNSCNRNVYMSLTVEDFQKRVAEGHCTALHFKWLREERYMYAMGEGNSHRDTTLIMQKLRDNLGIWVAETEPSVEGDEEEDPISIEPKRRSSIGPIE